MARHTCTYQILLLSLSVFTLLIQTSCHNWVAKPMTYNTNFPTDSCRLAECSNACPPLVKKHEMGNTPARPAATWRRGTTVRVCYVRNQHVGGIASFSLVPVSVMNSKAAHARFVLFKTCWSGGVVRCRNERIGCGTDRTEAMCRNVKVPSQLPDGDYVLGHAWYGGLHFDKKKGQFPDFRSCSFVRVTGSRPSLKCNRPYEAYFDDERGAGGKKRISALINGKGQCLTSATEPGQCYPRGCRRKSSFFAKPPPFNGRAQKVQTFTCDDVRKAMRTQTAAGNMLQGNCDDRVCCHKACNKCGGPRCEREVMGGRNCCVGTIERSGRHCCKDKPPCVRPEARRHRSCSLQ